MSWGLLSNPLEAGQGEGDVHGHQHPTGEAQRPDHGTTGRTLHPGPEGRVMVDTALPDDSLGAARLLQFEDCAAAIDGLFKTALAQQGVSAFTEFLEFVHRFSHLSVYNAMLVRVQRPGAAAVGSRLQWKRQGRTVSPDAIPIVILQPFGPVRFVYEIGDTEGREIPGERASSLYAEGRLDKAVYDKTVAAVAKYGVSVLETDDYGSLLAGTAAGIKVGPENLDGAADRVFRVKLNKKHDLPTRFATLAHELGQIYCGHIGADRKG